MDTREAKVQLPAYLIGDLSPKEAAMLEGHLDVNPEAREAKEQLSRQLLPVMNLPAPDVGEAALARLFMEARRELAKPERQPDFSWRENARFFMRVAAVLVATAVLGVVVAGVIPSGSNVVGSLVTVGNDVRVVRQNELVETPQGVPMTLELKAAGARIDLDGSSALVVRGRGHESSIEIMRGRVIVGASSHNVHITCGEAEVVVLPRSVAAIDFDAPFERIRGKGAVIELQRQTIAHVARVSERLFGGRIDTAGLPAEVANRRVSIYGNGLRREEFMAAFKSAAERHGVVFTADSRDFALTYNQGTAGSSIDESESILKVASLQGTVEFIGEKKTELSDRSNSVVVFANGTLTKSSDAEGAARAQRMVVWAGRSDMPHFKLSETVSNYIAMGQGGGRVITVATALPVGTVLSHDSIRYGGTLVRVGEPVKLSLPGANGGRLMGGLSSGIEVSADDPAGTRYFVPISNSQSR